MSITRYKIDVKDLKDKCGFPSMERIKKGPVAIIECPEEIPCNPCETICKKEAIKVGDPITNCPVLYADKCDGCGMCIAICPGLAVFTIDYNYSDDKAAISIPNEMLTLPEKGDTVDALDRNGEVVCEAEVIRVRNPKSNDNTAIVTIAIPKEHIDKVRNFKLKK